MTLNISTKSLCINTQSLNRVKTVKKRILIHCPTRKVEAPQTIIIVIHNNVHFIYYGHSSYVTVFRLFGMLTFFLSLTFPRACSYMFYQRKQLILYSDSNLEIYAQIQRNVAFMWQMGIFITTGARAHALALQLIIIKQSIINILFL